MLQKDLRPPSEDNPKTSQELSKTFGQAISSLRADWRFYAELARITSALGSVLTDMESSVSKEMVWTLPRLRSAIFEPG